MTSDELIARLVAIADERPNVSIGHVVEHELPELRAQAEAMNNGAARQVEQSPGEVAPITGTAGSIPAAAPPSVALPVAHVCTDDEMRHRDPRWGRVKWINGCDEDECAGMFLYTHCAPDLAARVARLEDALRLIASCESRAPGDVVDIARAALARWEA